MKLPAAFWATSAARALGFHSIMEGYADLPVGSTYCGVYRQPAK
jgi:hypothetical protein